MMDSAEFTHIPVLAEQTVSILSETPRPLKRLIQRELENPLAMEILQGKVPDNSTVKIRVKGDALVVNA